MTHRHLHLAIVLSLAVAACAPQEAEETTTEATDAIAASDDLIMPGEVHFANMRQLTDGGDNNRGNGTDGGDGGPIDNGSDPADAGVGG